MTEYGTPEERAAVKSALVALDQLNGQLRRCADLGIDTRLIPERHIRYREPIRFVAEFTKTTMIMPP